MDDEPITALKRPSRVKQREEDSTTALFQVSILEDAFPNELQPPGTESDEKQT